MTQIPPQDAHRTPANIWVATLGQLEMQVTRANYDTWLRDTQGLRYDDGGFIVGVQSDFASEWLGTRMRALITRTLARVLGHRADVSFEVAGADDGEPPALLARPEVNHDEIPDFLRRNRTPAPALNPAYTFEAFVVGDENRLAADAARAAVERPGSMNPLTLYGPSGLGKTHLLNAIGHAAYARSLSIIYAPAERFANEYVRALQGSKLDEFRRRYRSADVLLIDDVQFFEGKEKFQHEFLHTFNDLHAAGKQLVVTCCTLPSQLGGLIDALQSRLHWGLLADLRKPSFPTRLAILRAKARAHALHMPDAALEAIAERCCPTVRELEGYLNRVIAYAPLKGGEPTPQIVAEALAPFSATAAADAPPLDPDAVVAAVSQRIGVTPGEIRGRSRTRDVTYARHLAMYLLKHDANKTVAEVGRFFGNRDHSTVLAALSRIGLEQTTRPETREDLIALRTTLQTEPPSLDARAG